MKVYVITAGAYSDYHIEAVTLDPDKAELLRKLHSGYDEAHIEEFDTEEEADIISQKYTSVWTIEISKHGEVGAIKEAWHFGDGQFENRFSFPYWKNGGFVAEVCHDSKNAAIKIALDTRAKMLAEKYGL